MRHWSAPLLFALLASIATLFAAGDPGDVFLKAYQAYQTAERQETGNKLNEALQKYRECATLLEQLQKDSPAYEPLVIDFRLKKSRESIARVMSLQAPSAPADGGPALAPAAGEATPPPRISSSPRPATLRIPQFSTTYRIPIPGTIPPIATRPSIQSDDIVDTSDDGVAKMVINALKEKIRGLELRVRQEKQANADLNNQLLESTAQIQNALTDRDRTKVQNVEMKAELDEKNRKIIDLGQANEQLVREKKLGDKQIADLQAAVDAAHADLEVADEYNGELFAKLGKAAQFIDSSEKIRKQLLADRTQLMGQVNAKSPEIAKLQQERDAAARKSETLQKQGENEALLEKQNKDMAAKLAAAQKQLAKLSENSEDRKKVETGLRSEVESVNKALASMRGQLATGGKRITELEKQLAATSSATAVTTGAMADENALLKSLVARQLAEQAKRQQARKLVEEEMEKLQIRSKDLADRLSALGSAETPLTPQEQKLFDKPVSGAGGDLGFSLVIAKKEPTSDLPGELVDRAKEANRLSQQNRMDEARAIYEDIARKAPQSYFAEVNLGITERQLGDYPKAIAAFKRALELKEGDAFALMNLGKTEYSSGDLPGSIETLKKAVAADSESYVAHYLLGVALNQNGDREGARREVSRALDLKPDYLPAVQLNGELGDQKTQNSTPAAGAATGR